ncbi:MAG: serine/threonine protein kinase [Pyrinomonadaceae bacterium]
MAVSAVKEKMLYCPKCSQSYEEGVQRFCANDGARLVSAASSGGQTKGIFTSVLNRTPANRERSKTFAEIPVLVNPEQNFPTKNVFQIPATDNFPAAKQSSVSEKEPQISKPETPLPTAKPVARLIRPNEVPASQAKLGDRAVNPTGREALTWENPEILIGQTVKGRYSVVKELGEDETGFIYLAEDKIGDGKKAVVRVLMEEDADDLSSKILAEERVSLSHVNHPNVAHLFDSGELLEGFPFIITEYVDGFSLKEKFHSGVQFNTMRTARIIRQAANAVGEAHRNGVLHRNLKPKNIILGVTETGAEQVKVADFGVFDGFEEQSAENLAYLAPEQLDGKFPTFASDIYALAVIAFQMLTKRIPFNFSTEKELLKAQREGLNLLPTNLRLDIPPPVDEILEKALAFNPAERYPKARDFGDAFFNALTTASPANRKDEAGENKLEESKENLLIDTKESLIPELELDKQIAAEDKFPAKETEIPIAAETAVVEPEVENETAKITDNLPWQKRSPEQVKPINGWRIGSMVLLILIFCAAVWGIWNYFLNRQSQTVYAPPKSETANQNVNQQLPENTAPESATPKTEIESPPLPRALNQPPDTIFFQNSKENLKGDLAKNFRGFSFYYPKDWVKNPSETNFVDVARVGATGTPIEQMIVTYYDSKGTLSADMENFPRLVQESSKSLSAAIPDYRLISQGQTTIDGDWKTYEIKFQGSGITKNGDKITLWGRRLWIPAARLGVKTGFLITMLATSNSPEVKSADDVGVKGELANVLKTFEPVPLDTGY